MMNRILRNIIAVFLCLIIFISVFYIIKNIDDIFNSRIKYQYPDGCIEEFLNTELITPECDLGKFQRTKEKEESSLEVPFTFNYSVWKIKE